MKRLFKRWLTAGLLVAGMGFALPVVWAQLSALSKYVKAEDFKMPMAYYEGQYQGQARAIISAKEARPLTGAKSYLLKEMKLDMFHETGERELVVLSPECVYNSETMVASSAARFQLQTTNEGRFAKSAAEDKGLFIEGEGYEWNHAAGRMLVSNKVHTVVHRQLFKDAPDGAQGAAVPQPLEIFSDHTDISLTNRTAYYTDNVRVIDPRTEIKSERLLVRGMTGTNSQIESVVAEGRVSILNKQDQSLATGEKAVYSGVDNRVTLTGNPSVETAQGKMFGDQVVLYRAQNELTSSGNVRMAIKPGPANNLSSSRQPLELAANDLKVNLTNRHAVFSGNVRAEDDKMRLTSEWLGIDGAEKGGTDRILAKENVVMFNKDDKSRATGGQGLFVASNNVVTLTGKPMLENSQGRMWAEKIVLYRNDNALFASENVRMEVQAAVAGKDGKSGKGSAGTAPLVLLANAAQINLTNRQAVYTGNVRADDTKMLITADKLTVKGQASTNRVDSILAEGNVTMTNRVDKSRATGGRAVYRADGEVLTLTGKPVLENDQGKLAGDTIVMDRARNLLTAKSNVRTEIQPRTAIGLMGKTNGVAAAPEPMMVFSDDVKLNLTNKLAEYHGNIRVDSSRMAMYCENMTVKSIQGTTSAGKTTNGVESIVAEGKVLIVNKSDNTRARGNKAVYLAATDSIELTGEPVIEKEQGNLIITVESKVIWHRDSNTLEADQFWSKVDPKAFQKERSKTNVPPGRASH